MNINKVNNDLIMMKSDLSIKKANLIEKLHRDVDRLIDEEIENYDYKRFDSNVGIVAFLRGLYYLSFAKFTDPVVYKMAHRVACKLRAKQLK